MDTRPIIFPVEKCVSLLFKEPILNWLAKLLFQFTHFLVPTLQAESVHTELNFAFYEFLLLSDSTNITKI